MVQQRNIRKFSPDDHYCNALFKYAEQLAIKFSDHCAFISTDDKCKIKVGEPNFPVAAVAHGKRVLVSKEQVLEVADHDTSSIKLIPTVRLSHDIPDEVDKSWHCGIIILYIDGSPEHRSNFLSMKITLIALQKSLNADLLVAVRTAPGH